MAAEKNRGNEKELVGLTDRILCLHKNSAADKV